MPSAEIITIGTEILLGEIVDTNARAVALALRETGIDLYRKVSVGDNPQRISQAIRESLERCDIIITTGGLGPTIDDPTRAAVAMAMNVETEYHPELWEQIQSRFRRYNRQPTENNRRQAFIPRGAIAIENPVGTAPSFIVEIGDKSIIALPGVPSEMQYLLQNTVIPYLRQRYLIKTIIKSRTLHTAGAGESQIDDLIGDLEQLTNPTVGLAAHSGQVDVRIVAKADLEKTVDDLIFEVETELRLRLGDWIYGANQETLEVIALQAVQSRGWTLAVVESGAGGELTRRLSSPRSPAFLGGEIIGEKPAQDELNDLTRLYRQRRQADVSLGLIVSPGSDRQDVFLVLVTPEVEQNYYRPYGGPEENAPRWAVNQSLDLIRRLRKEDK